MSGRPTRLCSLPDDVLVEITSRLGCAERWASTRVSRRCVQHPSAAAPPFQSTPLPCLMRPGRRHAALPLVCRRLHSLLYSPRLLQRVDVTFEHPAIESARALFGWLVGRCAGRMESLHMRLSFRGLPAAEQAEVAAQLPATLAVCGTAGGLARLAIGVAGIQQAALVVGSWAAALSGLQQLQLYSSGDTHITAPLRSLTLLRDLHLIGQPVLLPPSAALPTSLTRLSLGGNLIQHSEAGVVGNTEGLPLQVRCLPCGISGCSCTSSHAIPLLPSFPLALQIALLPRLHTLRLFGWVYLSAHAAAAACEPLAGLHKSLESLELRSFTHLPPTPGKLAALTQLIIVNDGIAGPNPEATAANAAILQAALLQLRRLACLALSSGSSEVQQLPGGLTALRWLVAPLPAVAASLPALSQCRQLQRLGLCSRVELEPAAAVRVLQWAAGRSALQLLELQMSAQGCRRDVVAALLALQRARPELEIEAKEDVIDAMPSTIETVLALCHHQRSCSACRDRMHVHSFLHSCTMCKQAGVQSALGCCRLLQPLLSLRSFDGQRRSWTQAMLSRHARLAMRDKVGMHRTCGWPPARASTLGPSCCAKIKQPA